MSRRATLLMLASVCAAAAPALASPGPVEAGACAASAAAAEEAYAIPPGLLAAIGRAESGRPDGAGGTQAWPWSIDAGGRDYALASAAEAIALVGALRARGVQVIDVGCFQMNLFYHPDAFATLEDAFDPARNALAAARFLRELRAAAPDWPQAVARYHSADPARGEPYMRRVMAFWGGAPAPEPSPVPAVETRGAWTAPRPAAFASAVQVKVFVPGGTVMASTMPRRGLPVVFVPRGAVNHP